MTNSNSTEHQSENQNQIGLVIKSQSGFYRIYLQGGAQTIICQLRGKMKRGKHEGDLCSIGDKVRLQLLADGSGVIEEVFSRKNEVVRLDPRPQGEYRQILIANADQVIFVFASTKPEPKLRMLDRFLVIAEKQGVKPIIVINKVDLIGVDEAKLKFGMYEKIGYRIIYTSVVTGEGISQLRERMVGRISALAGPSGVGKSSLMNVIEPGIMLATGSVSEFNEKGRHTTNVRQLHPLTGGGWVADAPGWKSLGLWDTYPEEIDAYFPDIRPFVEDCAFSDCTHSHEPGCAVIKAVNEGKIDPRRFDSFQRLREGQE